MLQAHNQLLCDEIAALRARNEMLAPNPVVRSLCEKVVEMALETKEYLRLSQVQEKKSKLLLRRVAKLRNCMRAFQVREEELNERIFQLEGGIATLQQANHLKTLELHRLKQCKNELREYFTCSISQDLMTQPYVLSTGQVYEHACIMPWLNQSSTCPNTGMQLRAWGTCPNTGIKLRAWDHVAPVSIVLRNVCAVIAQM
jgi:hypothetical protein